MAKEVLATNNLQGVATNPHQWELTNSPEIIHRCVVCHRETKVIWRNHEECFGYPDLFQDMKERL